MAGLAVLLVWGVLCLFARTEVYLLRPLFTARNPFSCNELFQRWGCLWRLLCYAISFVTGFALLCVVPARPLPVVTAYGQRTLQVYFWHVLILALLGHFGCLTFLASSRWGKLLWLFLAVILSYPTGTRWFSFPTEQLLRYAQTTKWKDQNVSL